MRTTASLREPNTDEVVENGWSGSLLARTSFDYLCEGSFRHSMGSENFKMTNLRLDPWGGEGEVDLGYQYVDCGPEWNRRMNELCSLSLDYAGG